jgi:DNA processing protein
LVRDAEDILAALTTFGVSMTKPKPKVAPSSPPAQSGLARAELAKASLSPAQGRSDTVNLPLSILDRLGPSPLAEDQLIRDLALPAAAVAPHLLELEMSGRIQRQAGGLLALVV